MECQPWLEKESPSPTISLHLKLAASFSEDRRAWIHTAGLKGIRAGSQLEREFLGESHAILKRRHDGVVEIGGDFLPLVVFFSSSLSPSSFLSVTLASPSFSLSLFTEVAD